MVREVKRLTHVKVLACICQGRAASECLSCNNMPSGLGLPKLMCRAEILVLYQSMWSLISTVNLVSQVQVFASTNNIIIVQSASLKKNNIKVCQSYEGHNACYAERRLESKFGTQFTGREAILITAHRLKLRNLYFADQATQKLRNNATP